MTVDMRRMKDAPADQDVGALGKVNQKHCDICGKPTENLTWNHCDSWTKWMRFGCGCNLMVCQDEKCKEEAEAKRKELLAANRKKAEEAEIEMLKNIDPGQLARLRYRYYDSFNCSPEFRDWVQSAVGEDRMKEMLDVPCERCGQTIGPPKYTFEDKDGTKYLWTLDEIERYCYQVMDRDPEKEPFFHKMGSASSDYRVGGMKSEILFERPVFHYFVQKGWSTERMTEDQSKWNEAMKATRGPDCGGDYYWSYGHFIYHEPTMTYLGVMAKRDGDWPQVVQSNAAQLEKERNQLRERCGGADGDYGYMDHPDWSDGYRAIEAKKEWTYFCSKACCEESGVEGVGTLFI